MWSVDGKQFVYVCSFVSAGRAVRARLCLCLIRNTSPHRQPWTSSSGSTPFSCTFWRSFGQHHPRMRSATPVVLGAALRVIAITVVVALYQHLFFLLPLLSSVILLLRSRRDEQLPCVFTQLCNDVRMRRADVFTPASECERVLVLVCGHRCWCVMCVCSIGK